MSRVVIIGATGHIGSYLVPRLVRGGHEVIAMSRGIRGPYLQRPEWDSVTTITVDRDAADAGGTFGTQVAALALSRPDAAGGSFHVVAAQAMTLRGLAAGVAAWFGRAPVLEFVDWAEFGRQAGPGHAEATREHTFRGIAASIDRARRTLGYAPRYSSLEALYEALTWLVTDGQVDVGGLQFQLSAGDRP